MAVIDHLDEGMKHVLDWISLSTVVVTLMDLAPTIAALLPIIWYSIRIYETKTVQSLLGRLTGDPEEL